jgi:hypothetical protein
MGSDGGIGRGGDGGGERKIWTGSEGGRAGEGEGEGEGEGMRGNVEASEQRWRGNGLAMVGRGRWKWVAKWWVELGEGGREGELESKTLWGQG